MGRYYEKPTHNAFSLKYFSIFCADYALPNEQSTAKNDKEIGEKVEVSKNSILCSCPSLHFNKKNGLHWVTTTATEFPTNYCRHCLKV